MNGVVDGVQDVFRDKKPELFHGTLEVEDCDIVEETNGEFPDLDGRWHYVLKLEAVECDEWLGMWWAFASIYTTSESVGRFAKTRPSGISCPSRKVSYMLLSG